MKSYAPRFSQLVQANRASIVTLEGRPLMGTQVSLRFSSDKRHNVSVRNDIAITKRVKLLTWLRMIRLAVVMTHPIQYFAPLWAYLGRSNDIEPHVFFASSAGLNSSYDPGFGARVSWDIPLLDGYISEFCKAVKLPIGQGPSANWPLGLRRIFKTEKYDAVLVHGYANAAAWAGILAAHATKTPLLLRGDTHSKERPRTLRSALRRGVMRQLFSKYVTAAIAIGKWNREFWLENGIPEDRIEIATYAVDNLRLRSAVATTSERTITLRNSWISSEEDVVFVFCGKLIELKRADLLLNAIARLKDPHAVVVIVGSGPLEKQLKVLATQLGIRVIWAGFVNQQELPHYYAASDVQVLPSNFEQWGLVVNEGLVCGCPCIVSDVVGAGPDLIGESGAGAIFPSGDIEGLTNKLRLAMDKPTRELWQSRCQYAVETATYESFAVALKRLKERGLI